MDTAHHTSNRCPVIIHPAAATNPSTIRDIQKATGQLVMIVRGRPQLGNTTLPAFEDFSGYEGGAA
ncbi:hypothetical protein [Pseudomonas sp. LRF_L74]|uniref:hypothetical protein n=1 Tax=Pseudomonas sp. LRF_L74 TaxID=3369422 RepID=UPI003F5FB7AD